MKIKNLSLKNFRSHTNIAIEFDNDFIIFYGPNATGKTNILESIYFLSIFKSFRDTSDYLFLKGTFTAEIRAIVETEGEEHLLEVFLENRGKVLANFKLDGVRKSRKMVQNFLSTVIFEPTDVDLLNKPSDQRRRYLNMVISQKNKQYLEDLHNYKKIITQKNQLLFNIKNGKSSTSDLTIWNEQQALFGTEIIVQRKEYIAFLNTKISELYAEISGFFRPIEVDYMTVAGDTKQTIYVNFKKELFQNQEREIAQSATVVGPHRDDFTLRSEGQFLSPFSSRGEHRSQVLALKILELEYLSNGEDRPILLLDDVLSELDDDRRTFLLKYLQNRFQTFITTTSPIEMPAQNINVKNLVNPK